MSLEVEELIRKLSSPHVWERQVAVVELGDLGDIRAVGKLFELLKSEEYDEIRIAAEKALERIAKANGFETVEELKLFADRKEREVVKQDELNDENFEEVLTWHAIHGNEFCIGAECLFYQPPSDEPSSSPNEKHCTIKEGFVSGTEQKRLINTLLLFKTADEWLTLMKTFKSCQKGFLFSKDLLTAAISLKHSKDVSSDIWNMFLITIQQDPEFWEKNQKTINPETLEFLSKKVKKSRITKSNKKIIIDRLEALLKTKNRSDKFSARISLLENELTNLEKELTKKSLFGVFKKKQKKAEIQKKLVKAKEKYSELKQERKKAKKAINQRTKILESFGFLNSSS